MYSIKINLFVIVTILVISACTNKKHSHVNPDGSNTNTERSYASSGFEDNKGSIYAIYNRSLRKNPDLEGKIVFNIEIDPEGNVVDTKIVSSELDAPKMEQKLLIKIKSFKFPQRKSSENLVVTYPIEFVPY